ncbi:glycerol-3-phosphate dehydrogenase [Shewanella surugensis]|uniref:Glycerol-3-phosphate dehydrogenase n=1 Tax=Shewanella surugensis TaxID=212020 RepID=A0ABT0LAI4_9GAMM|nr:glycerol-3-phosphate dehydrogenase [Shewanella surugensis]MCL1124176.1 glycerol-3-phosphate dehydrogenase [Shewanella surugensis]
MTKKQETVDLFVVGGGINGVGIAADAAGRGLSVFLCEQNDLAQATSSASSKLIHGGLRYLEHYEFRLVREALAEREVMLKKAPHIVSPMRFRLPHQPHLRPAWMIRAGLFLYDILGKRETLAASKNIKFDTSSPLKKDLKRGFEYSDCYVDDARLVVLNAIAARNKGATVVTQTRCISAKRKDGFWEIHIENTLTHEVQCIYAKGLVNAAGPWVASFIEDGLKLKAAHGIRLIKGSHIIVPKIHDEKQAYILQNEDQRIVFVIPYNDDFSLIGTTDVEYQGDPAAVAISSEEKDYLISIVNQHFSKQISIADIVSSYSGVRPLCDDESDKASTITRDYTVEIEDNNGHCPLLSVFGGKITTYRKLAESAMTKLTPYYDHIGTAWTVDAPLPGTEDIHDTVNFKAIFEKKLLNDFPWLPRSIATRFSRSYGSLCLDFLAEATELTELGEHFGAGLYAAEVDYLMTKEWGVHVDDILWRRTKLGLYLNDVQQQRVADYLAKKSLNAAPDSLLKYG